MRIIDEVEKILAELPPEQAVMLKRWLIKFEAAHHYKQLKAYTKALKTLSDFEKANSKALWN